MPRRPVLPFAITIAAYAVCASNAEACSLVPPWEIRDTRMVAFFAVATPDTVLAGNGSMRPVVVTGPSTAGGPRQSYGQRVRLGALGANARQRFPSQAEYAVLVPWGYDAACSPVPWGGSARWLPVGTSGLFRARLRRRTQWVANEPTFDVLTTDTQPYVPPTTPTGGRWAEYSTPAALPAEVLLHFYDRLAPPRASPDSTAALAELRALAADTVMAMRYPVRTILWKVRQEIALARQLTMKHPIVGLFRFTLWIDAQPARLMYVRTSRKISSFEGTMEGATDDQFGAPPPPNGYYVAAAAAPTVEQLPPDCEIEDDRVLAYLDLDWHGPLSSDGTGVWRGSIDVRLMDAIRTPDERAFIRSGLLARLKAQNEARRARADAAKRNGASARSIERSYFLTERNVVFTQRAGRPMTVVGSFTLENGHQAQVSGERISTEPLACRH